MAGPATLRAVSPLVVPVAVASLLLAVAGAAKLVNPAPTGVALRTLRLPSSAIVVRLVGATELVVGVATLALGGRLLALLLGLAYLSFAVVVVVSVRRGDTASCGCFGRVDTPPSLLHAAVNASLGTAGVGAAVAGLADLGTILADQPAAGLPYLGLVGLATWATYLVLTILPLPTAAGAGTAPAVAPFHLVAPARRPRPQAKGAP